MNDLLNFAELWKRLGEGDESVLIEAKRGTDIGKSALDTVSAFSNEPDIGGGYIIFGIIAKEGSLFPDYEVLGVSDSDKIQSDLATQCRELLSVPIRPTIFVEIYHEKAIVIAYIPEASAHQKPVYVKTKGPVKGSYRRIGSTDQVCTDDDVALFYQVRGRKTFDEDLVHGSSLQDVDKRAIETYRLSRAPDHDDGTNELLRYSDEDLLYALNATSSHGNKTCLTVGGLVLFGKPSALRRYLPMTRVDYIRVDGIEWVPDAARRYQGIEKLGPLLLTIPQLIAQVLEDVPKAFNLPVAGDYRQDVPLIPRNVIREAIVNALMHRSYKSNQAVQIIRYANRIEIKNPGHSLIPEERLGEPGSKTRNPVIAAALHDAKLAETKGTGIRVMREAMGIANLTAPLIESDRQRDEFTLRLLVHHLYGQEDVRWLAKFKDFNLIPDDACALVVLRQIGLLDNAMYRSLSKVDVLTASGRLRKLRDQGLLEQEGRSSNTYYTAGPRMRELSETRRKSKSSLLRRSPTPCAWSCQACARS
ncbi:MAG: ATP-binding protein [Pirellulales bacterium]